MNDGEKLKGVILAGGFEQYRFYLRENDLNPDEYKYIRDRHDLRGLPFGIEFITYGTWYKREIHLKEMFMYEAERKEPTNANQS